MPSCHSTNDHLGTLISKQKELEEGTVVITPEQIKGRGQRGNVWETLPNANITLSFLLKPKFLEARDQFQLNVAISLGVYDLLETFFPSEVKIKWPNDILISNQKIAGILIENYLIGQNISQTIVGIGLNINQPSFNGDFKATSLFIEKGKKFQLPQLSELLLEKIEKRYISLQEKGYKALLQEYYKHLFWYQEEGNFQEVSKDGTMTAFKGYILGVNENGCLSIAVNNKKIKHYGFKEVKHLY